LTGAMQAIPDSERSTAEKYRAFAEVEARGLSPVYDMLALGVADDPEVVALIDELPVPKRQVNLVFSSARLLSAPMSGYGAFRDWLVRHWPEVRGVALTHATQTNEPRRTAVLLPVLAALPGPLALIEVGASAGLCLYPDRYSYRYDDEPPIHPGSGPSPVLLSCATRGPVPLPSRVPTVAWRAGIDLNPLDVRSDDDVRWLSALTWPEHEDRRERLAAAVGIARQDPPRIERGDLNELLPALAAEAPKDATLVVFHTAVLLYLDRAARRRFVDTVSGLDAVWLSNEGDDVTPGVAERLPRRSETPAFVLARDGEPLAFTQPHGASLEWLG
jgi:hypothetical protein